MRYNARQFSPWKHFPEIAKCDRGSQRTPSIQLPSFRVLTRVRESNYVGNGAPQEMLG